MNLLILDSYITDIVNEGEEAEPDSNSEVEEDTNIEVEEKQTYFEPYMATLKIPKINFERGFYDKNSTLNNVNYNVLFHKKSDYPDKKNGNVILAGHSGSSAVSYFNDLYKLDKGDLAYILYNNNTYTYKIVNIYQEEKDGNIAIYRDKDKSILTLITCTNNDNTKQTIYILERV